MSLSVPKQNSRRSSLSARRGSEMAPAVDQTAVEPKTSASSSSLTAMAQKASLQKLAKSLIKKKEEQRQNDTWSKLIKSALLAQRGKIPLLLAVEAGNQSMCRELLSAQTAEQLKVSEPFTSFLTTTPLSPPRLLIP